MFDDEGEEDDEIEEDEGDDMGEDEEEHLIFLDIYLSNLEAVQQRVLADAAVLEARGGHRGATPLIHAIEYEKTAIALWLLEHRGEHDVNKADGAGWTALQYATRGDSLELVQALVAAGANPASVTESGNTPLIEATTNCQTDIVAFLLRLPAVRASIDATGHFGQFQYTALSHASGYGHQAIVELLLDAGADPTIPVGPGSPLNKALRNNHHAIAALIIEPDRARALHKARSLLGGGAASLACLQGRMEQGQALPHPELTTPEQHRQQQQHRQHRQQQQGDSEKKERLRATAAFAVGVSGGEKDGGLCDDLYMKLLG